jgi:restriction endonuclease
VVLKVQGEQAREGLINHDLLPAAEEDAARISFDRLEGIFDLISEIQRSLAFNVNKQLALETLMLGIRKETGTGKTTRV